MPLTPAPLAVKKMCKIALVLTVDECPHMCVPVYAYMHVPAVSLKSCLELGTHLNCAILIY